MRILDLYDWALPNQAEHLARYANNESLYGMARSMWASLESASMYFLVVAILLAMISVWLYYYVYNNYPGRKYRIRHWFFWMIGLFALTAIVTFVLGNSLVSSNLIELRGFLLRLSPINSVYAVAIYFVASFVICNIPVPTNAYRFLKIGK